MIKIKDYIFNENDIRRIYYNKDESCLCVGFRDKDLTTNFVDNATLNDIEWNYEDKQIRKCLDSIDREEELEEENKKLKELCDKYEEEHNNEFQCWKKDRKELLVKRKIIDKAIEYIEQWRDTKTKRIDSRLKRTLEILKGEENE